jgi:predicted nucleic acid-binding protein
MVASDLSTRPIVSNTSPLINLAGVGLLDLLPALYGTIWVPEAVSREYAAGMRAGDTSLEEFAWIKIAPPVAVQTRLPPGLGRGEVEAISLSIAENARAILLDERLARSVARSKGLLVVGTLAVLVAAKQSKLLPAVKPVIDTMIEQGRHISERLYAQILVAAGEEE